MLTLYPHIQCIVRHTYSWKILYLNQLMYRFHNMHKTLSFEKPNILKTLTYIPTIQYLLIEIKPQHIIVKFKFI